MGEVSLDGLVVELAHGLPADEAFRRIERAARDLAEGRFAKHGPTIETPEPLRALLRAEKADRTMRFQADIRVAAERVTVAIAGFIQLSFLETTLAGGAAGVRRRVSDEVERALKERLAAA